VPVVALGTAAESVRIGLRPRQASGAAVSIDLFRAAQGEVREWRLVASAGWLWSREWGRLRGWAGPLVGAGVAAQTAADQSTRDSGLLTAAATLGAVVNVTRDIGLWTEGEVEAVGYRRAGRVAWSAVPAAWIGSAFAF
jgi:hypothetical protein